MYSVNGQTLTLYSSVTVCLQLPDLWSQYLHTHRWAQICLKEYTGVQKPLCSFHNSSLSEIQQLTAHSWRSLPLSRKQAICRKSPFKNIPLNKGTPAHNCPLLYKKENWKLVWKLGVSDLYPCSTCQVQVRRVFTGLKHQIPPPISNRIQNFTFTFNFNWPLARWSAYLLIFLID
jgi:hypothetical protein